MSSTDVLWTRICDLPDVPVGEVKEFVIEQIAVVVVRGPSSTIVIPPSCPHMENPLTEAFFDGHVLSCPKHLWQWSVDTGEPVNGIAECPLLRYESKVEGISLLADLRQELIYPHQSD